MCSWRRNARTRTIPPHVPHSAHSQTGGRLPCAQPAVCIMLRARRGLGSSRGTISLSHAHSYHTESKNPCTHCQPSPDSARVPTRLPEHGACDSGPRLTGPRLGDVAVRLRRASLRPGPATADGFAQLRPPSHSQETGPRHSRSVELCNRDLAHDPSRFPLGRSVTPSPTGPTVASGDHGADPED